MAQRDSSKITRGLLRKGFRSQDTDHEWLYFYLDGLKTSVRTKISHGSKIKAYGDELLGMMSKQLCLPKYQLLELIDCPLSEEEYAAKLLACGRIRKA